MAVMVWGIPGASEAVSCISAKFLRSSQQEVTPKFKVIVSQSHSAGF